MFNLTTVVEVKVTSLIHSRVIIEGEIFADDINCAMIEAGCAKSI